MLPYVWATLHPVSSDPRQSPSCGALTRLLWAPTFSVRNASWLRRLAVYSKHPRRRWHHLPRLQVVRTNRHYHLHHRHQSLRLRHRSPSSPEFIIASPRKLEEQGKRGRGASENDFVGKFATKDGKTFRMRNARTDRSRPVVSDTLHYSERVRTFIN